MSSAAVKRYTVEDYFELERKSVTKHEFFDGEIFAMAGASEAHNLISVNLLAAFHSAFKSRDCRTYPSDMRVFVPSGLYTYPDATVVCGPREIDVYAGLETLKNPRLIIEVLSKSTETYDRDAKFDFYKTIPSLLGYLLVSQEKPKVDHFARRDDDRWLLTTAKGLDASVRLPELDVTLSLADIYAKVEFPKIDETIPPEPETTFEPHPGDKIR